ncbi:hypothetical protein DAMA08_000260 [Martiniozyma asiatica (nom. inval.)]|nr:hypothetical protein DAMA08_000260 [Martiniozyma asiatica]
MPKIKKIDSYILSTKELLNSHPECLITTSHTLKHNKPLIRFKTYTPKSGICYVFETRKVKDFAKVCNALGARGCVVDGKEIDGLACALMNANKEDIVIEEKENSQQQSNTAEKAGTSTSTTGTATVDDSSNSKKKKKKKGKKN